MNYAFVVDAQIVLAMFLARRNRPDFTSPKRQLLKLLPTSTVRWLGTPDIINDYERVAAANGSQAFCLSVVVNIPILRGNSLIAPSTLVRGVAPTQDMNHAVEVFTVNRPLIMTSSQEMFPRELTQTN